MTQPSGQAEKDAAVRGFFRAGQIGIWVWIALSVIPVVIVIVCCALCAFGGIVGSVTPDPTPSGW